MEKMRVLVGCEFSGIVRDAFRERGHRTISCDFLPSERPGPHLQRDVRAVLLLRKFDLALYFPPCTYLCGSGARWWKGRRKEQRDAISFVKLLMESPVPRIALENPVGILSTVYRKPDQIIQPYQFGHPEKKSTCLWLKNLPLLKPTKILKKWNMSIWKMGPSPDRWKNRSRTFQGIADAMADQWGSLSPI